MSFVVYDIILLIIFATFISIFLYSRRKGLKREGLLLLYKTSWGIRLIRKFGEKHRKLLRFFGWISIILGYILMATMIYLFGRIVWVYIFSPEFVRLIKIPPIMPLIPYLPSVFKLDFLPPFYFIYWILIIAIIAIPHEFAHGLYAIYNKVRIKTTGFGFFPYFLPVFLAAFVELDEKELSKKSRFGQMATLSAGTFANVLTGILFFFIMWGFFYVGFAPGGVVFDTYSYSIINVSAIQAVNNITLNNGYNSMLELMEDSENINEIKTHEGNTYWTSKSLFEDPRNRILFEENSQIVVYDDSPAINAGLSGAIFEIDDVRIDNRDELVEELSKKSPNQEIIIKTITKEGEKEYSLVLGQHPEIEEFPWLGIGFLDRSSGGGILDKVFSITTFFRKPHTYYKPVWNASEFIYNLLWWIVLISFSIALINMLPVGLFDGGRFFYLTILAITGSEAKARKSFRFITMLFLFFLLMILFFWVWSMFF
jgi:membrane-associated protease RseP (regulator of RpoE activity)